MAEPVEERRLDSGANRTPNQQTKTDLTGIPAWACAPLGRGPYWTLEHLGPVTLGPMGYWDETAQIAFPS